MLFNIDEEPVDNLIDFLKVIFYESYTKLINLMLPKTNDASDCIKKCRQTGDAASNEQEENNFHVLQETFLTLPKSISPLWSK